MQQHDNRVQRQKVYIELECGPMSNVMATQGNVRGALC